MAESKDTMPSSQNLYRVLFGGVILLAVFNALFLLDAQPVQDWDEARRGVGAYEMMQTGRYFVQTYRGKLDYFGFKPPLGYWFIVASFRLLGQTVFALRLPAALSAIGCVVALMLALHFRGMRYAALISGAILATCTPFFCNHSARTGDFDAPLVFLICLAVLSIELPKNKRTRAVLLGLCVAFSFLLKGLAVIYIVLILGIWLIVRHELLRRNWRSLVLAVLTATVPVGLYAWQRSQVDGLEFFHRMVQVDAATRPFTTFEGHDTTFWRCFDKHIIKFHWYWFVLSGASIAAQWRTIQRETIKRYLLYLLWALVPIVCVAVSRTRLPWYLNPAYPGIAAIVGISVGARIRELSCRNKWATLLLALMVLIITAISEARVVRNIHKFKRAPDQEVLLAIPAGVSRGHSIYADKWRQSNVFVSQVLRGLLCKQCRGVDKFLSRAGDNDLFLVSRKDIDKQYETRLRTVAENDLYVVVAKKPAAPCKEGCSGL